jgi:hypothetical protein
MSTNSIPTTGINGIRFRSRIEATWAEFFTKLGWDWEYEPLDLNGYIPDFIVKFPHKHLLVEVKGDRYMKNLTQYADKIIKSGWEGEYLLVCSTLENINITDEFDKQFDGLCVGLLSATHECYSSGIVDITEVSKEYGYLRSRCICPKFHVSYFAFLSICECCEKYTIFRNEPYWCRYCGQSPNLEKTKISKNGYGYKIIQKFWNESKNHSQWNPK